MKNENTKVTYWKQNSTGMIYKYFGDSKPWNYTAEWRETTAYEWEHQNAVMVARYLH